jgi:hypothetical protein
MTLSYDRTVTSHPARPSARRRLALAVTGFLALALPLLWGVGALLMLLTGQESEHRFHQLTGQGVLFALLWALGPAALVVAGWRGRRTTEEAGLAHLAFVAASVLTAVAVPTNGAPVLAALVAVTAGLLWWALPERPTLRHALGDPDPVLAPLALLAAALFAPYALHQRHLQLTRHDEHATMSHYLDMVWLSSAVVAWLLVAAFARSCRRLAVIAGGTMLLIGAAGLLWQHRTTWFLLATALGAATMAAGALRSRGSSEPSTRPGADV